MKCDIGIILVKNIVEDMLWLISEICCFCDKSFFCDFVIVYNNYLLFVYKDFEYFVVFFGYVSKGSVWFFKINWENIFN